MNNAQGDYLRHVGKVAKEVGTLCIEEVGGQTYAVRKIQDAVAFVSAKTDSTKEQEAWFLLFAQACPQLAKSLYIIKTCDCDQCVIQVINKHPDPIEVRVCLSPACFGRWSS